MEERNSNQSGGEMGEGIDSEETEQALNEHAMPQENMLDALPDSEEVADGVYIAISGEQEPDRPTTASSTFPQSRPGAVDASTQDRSGEPETSIEDVPETTVPEAETWADGSVQIGGEGQNVSTSMTQTRSQASEWPPYCDPNYKMPTEIVVRVESEDGNETHMVVVRIEKNTETSSGGKAYLGGYRHKNTGRVYHHACTQFGRRERVSRDTSHLRSRTTQTATEVTRSIQCTRESGTQMERVGLHLSEKGDRPLEAGVYVTAEEYWFEREGRVVTIQRYWRGYSARVLMWRMQEQRWVRQQAKQAAQKKSEIAAAETLARQTQRRLNPKTAADFEILYNELRSWHEEESIKNASLPADERKKATAALLQQETRLLQTIGRLKQEASRGGQSVRVNRMLSLMSKPKRWEMADGNIAEVHTPWTHRAKELQALFAGLEAPLLGVEERLEVLLDVKWTVQEFDCRLTRELVELLDREADLLRRGRSDESMAGLRQRMRNLFLMFIETPDFNPEASRFLRAPPKYQHLTTEAAKSLGSTCL